MRAWPAVDVTPARDSDLVLAIVDDFGPTAVEVRGDSDADRDSDDDREKVRVFFATEAARNAACAALGAAQYRAEPVDVDDEDWARRSQEGLGPVTVGRITITPPWQAPSTSHLAPSTAPGTIVIERSMGFGTGHHATTRLCLSGLQAVDLSNRFVLDVGTGSGILAIAAVGLGAARAVGVDDDPDAIQSANENLALNRVETVEFRVADLFSAALTSADVDVITANLTGAFLVRAAGLLLALLRPGGTLIVSGLLQEERHDVVRAFEEAGSTIVWEQEEEGWVALGMKKS